MVQPVSTVVSWGGDLSDDEIETLGRMAGVSLSPESQRTIRTAFQRYVTGRALAAQAQPSKLLRQRLRSIQKAAHSLAEALGADGSSFDDFFSHRQPRNGIPRDKVAEETNARVELELVHLDIAFRKQHGFDPRFGDIDLQNLAWQLGQVSRAAERSSALVERQQSKGRPNSGARWLVEGIIEGLVVSGAAVTCWYSDIDGTYHGSFVRIAQWLRNLPQPIAEAESTLSKLAVRALARSKQDDIGSG
jgi:hypothetical protein